MAMMNPIATKNGKPISQKKKKLENQIIKLK